MTCVRGMTPRSHRPYDASLATRASIVQNHCPCLPMSERPGTVVPDCQLVSDIRSRRLRSSDSGFCANRRSRTTYSDWCFAAAGPRVWNSLPTELRQSDSLAQFKGRLKAHLFGLWDHSALWHWLLVNCRYRNILTYLLTCLYHRQSSVLWEWFVINL